MSERIILAIFGHEPQREGESQSSAFVGNNGVTGIIPREQNLGSYGILWFDVFKGEHIAKSFNATAVAEIYYKDVAEEKGDTAATKAGGEG
jgi:hypothetical protein